MFPRQGSVFHIFSLNKGNILSEHGTYSYYNATESIRGNIPLHTTVLSGASNDIPRVIIQLHLCKTLLEFGLPDLALSAREYVELMKRWIYLWLWSKVSRTCLNSDEFSKFRNTKHRIDRKCFFNALAGHSRHSRHTKSSACARLPTEHGITASIRGFLGFWWSAWDGTSTSRQIVFWTAESTKNRAKTINFDWI